MLSRLGCDIISLGKTGTGAFFDFGKSKTVSFRTEMDALPIIEKTGLDFASKNGFMHACGHDGNMAMLLSLCEILSGGLYTNYNVLAVFQPAEELCGGAETVIKSGIFSGIHIDEMYAIHLRPGLEAGKIFSRGGIICAGSSEVDIILSSRGGHIDADDGNCVELGAKLLISAKERLGAAGIFSSFGILRGGAARNISAQSAEIYGTLRYFSAGGGDTAREVLSAEGEDLPCACRVAVRDYAPPLENSETLMKKSRAEPLGERLMCADDFACYKSVVPEILYMLLGVGDVPPLHCDTFDFDENILICGVEKYIELLQC